MTPRFAFRDFQRLQLKYDELLSNFACFGFNFNLRHYNAEFKYALALCAHVLYPSLPYLGEQVNTLFEERIKKM